MKKDTETKSATAGISSISCSTFFVFDVESVGLHGEAFAVAGGVYDRNGKAIREFAYHCPQRIARGSDEDRKWVAENVTIHQSSIEEAHPCRVRDRFWHEWMVAKAEHSAVMAVECGWPVEARFLTLCVEDNPAVNNWEGPYPLHEIASVMLAAGMDPMASYARAESEKPAHEPLADARQSARLLATALFNLSNARHLAAADGGPNPT